MSNPGLEENANGVKQLCSSVDKHAYVRSMAVVGDSFAFCLVSI